MKMNEYKRTQIVSIALLCFALLLYFMIIPSQIKDVKTFGVSPRFLPNALALIIGLLAIWLFFEGRARKALDSKKIVKFDPAKNKIILASFVVLALNIFLMKYIGFIIVSILSIAALMWLYGERDIKKILAVSIIMPIVTSKFMELGLQLYLP